MIGVGLGLGMVRGRGGASAPAGQTFYVRAGGSNAAAGSSAAPWATLAYAIPRLTPGDTLLVGNGSWPAITVAVSGSAGRPITIKSENRRQAFIDVDQYAGVLVTGHYVTLEGLRIRNLNSHGIETQAVQHITCRDNWIHDCGQNGISLLWSDYMTMEDNLCEGNATVGWNSGISAYEPTVIGDASVTGPERNRFRRNICRRNRMLGLLDFDTGGTTAIAVGDAVEVGSGLVIGKVHRVELTSGSWAGGTAQGTIGILVQTSVPTRGPGEGTVPLAENLAITVGGVQRALTRTTTGLYTRNGIITDGNGIILDDWRWTQNPGTPYPYGAIVEDNLCYENGARGIQAYNLDGTCIVRNNTAWHNQRDGMQEGPENTWRGNISCQDCVDVRMVNNIAVADTTYDANITALGNFGGGFTVELYNNITFDGTPGSASHHVQNAEWVGWDNQFGVDPLMVDPENGDFRLHSNSPAVDAGTSDWGWSATDIDGAGRTASTINMGAFETVGPPYVPPARGDITAVGSATASAYGQRTNTSVPAIAGVEEGDVLYASEAIYRGYTTDILAVTPPDGFEVIGTRFVGTANAAGWLQCRVWRKIVGPADAGRTGPYAFNHDNAYAKFTMRALRGVDLTTPEDGVVLSNTALGDTATWEAIQTYTANARLMLFGWDFGDFTNGLTPPAGTTETLDGAITYTAEMTVPTPTTISGLTQTTNTNPSNGEYTGSSGTMIFAARAKLLFNPADTRLRWAPAAQSSPTSYAVTNGYYAVTLGDTEDAIFTNVGQGNAGSDMEITGGRNIRFIGISRRGRITVKNNKGSIYFEGCRIDLSSTTNGRDAINAYGAPGFTPDVTIQNCYVTGVKGTNAGSHGDIFQPQGPVGRVRIDKLTGDSNYQGIFIRPEFLITSAEIVRTNLAFNDLTNPGPDNNTYLLWPRNPSGQSAPGDLLYPVHYREVYVAQHESRTPIQAAVYPTNEAIQGFAGTVATPDAYGHVHYDGTANIWGKVYNGAPPGGDFVSSSAVGVGYVAATDWQEAA